MARIREIRPGFFTDEDIGRCTPQARLLLAGLYTLADRAGRLEDRPLLIRTALFPYDPATDVEALLAELAQPKLYGQASKSLVTRYVGADGRRYLQVNNFLKYQRFHPKEMPSRIPGPPGSDQGEPRPDSGEPRPTGEGLGLAGGEPRPAAEETGEPVVSRSGPSGSSGPSGPASAAAGLSPGSEQSEGGCRGVTAGADPPLRADGLDQLADASLPLARMRLAALAERVARYPFGGHDPTALLTQASLIQGSGRSFSDPEHTDSIPWIRATHDVLAGMEAKNRERAAQWRVPWEPVPPPAPPGEPPGSVERHELLEKLRARDTIPGPCNVVERGATSGDEARQA